MFLRTVGAHRASTFSHGLAVDRGSIPEDTFGHLAKYSCDECEGPCDEPVYKMTYRQTLEQPEEGVELCPSCGSEDCGEHQDPQLSLRAIRRNPNYRMSA